ncbi:VOC family protein [Phytohabitans kaempferiae]|uniref:VOC family protein n=1 Tax=Phytohabitans kaempferiae TaxID=1620943 RepID=A0ABV6M8Y5_9ACTN
MAENGVGDLRAATAQAWRAVERMRARLDDLGGGGVLGVLGERIAALLGEFAWEIGMVDPAEAPPGTRLDHVGIVVRDLRAAATLYGDLLGGTLVTGGVHHGVGVRSMHFTYPGGPGGTSGGTKVELLEPMRPGPIARFLEARGSGGMHHLTFFTPDLTNAIDDLARGGLTVVDIDRSAPEWHEAYLSPRDTQGCLVQIAQSPDIERVAGITVDSVLRDEWEWRDHVPRRVTTEARR